VVEVTVFGNDDLSRTTLVQPNGTITLPLLGEVPSRSSPSPRSNASSPSLLARATSSTPRFDVRIREYQSQFVWVVGEVNNPGRKPLRPADAPDRPPGRMRRVHDPRLGRGDISRRKRRARAATAPSRSASPERH